MLDAGTTTLLWTVGWLLFSYGTGALAVAVYRLVRQRGRNRYRA